MGDVSVVYSLNYFNKFVAFFDVVTVPFGGLLVGLFILGLYVSLSDFHCP